MVIDEEIYLEHFGIKGMKWGSRHDGPTGVSKAVNKHARKDAAEFARAKSFYGDGAGTRRKLINQTVDAKSKRLPGYKKAFDQHLDKQDQSKHAVKAVAERNRTDRRVRNKQRTGAIARRLTGEWGTQAAFVAIAAGGAAYMRNPQARAIVARKAKSVINSPQIRVAKKFVTDIINKYR